MSVKKTGFYEIHQKLGAKLVEFAGYYMPIQYSGIIEEHKHVRNAIGIFDVSHMGEFFVTGANALEFLQKITINDVSALTEGQVQYSAMCYPDGGIVDDLLVYKFKEKYMMVVNAANLDKDWEWSQKNLPSDVQLENVSDKTSLLAIQGPDSLQVLQKLTDVNLKKIPYYHFAEGTLAGVDMIISRTGYTGEMGFEVYFDIDKSVDVFNAIMDAGKEYNIQPIGLGARDTLRLEMKYALYGNDIDQTTNPIEAGLGWITKIDKGDFNGKEAILKVKKEGVSRKLVGFELLDKGVARHDYEIFVGDDKVGVVTSGSFSPMLEKSIGVGYVLKEFAAVDSGIEIAVRNRRLKAKIVKTPFYKPSVKS